MVTCLIFLLPALIEKSKALNFGQDYQEFTMFQGILNNTAPYTIVVLSLAVYVFSGKNELNTSWHVFLFFWFIKYCIIQHPCLNKCDKVTSKIFTMEPANITVLPETQVSITFHFVLINILTTGCCRAS